MESLPDSTFLSNANAICAPKQQIKPYFPDGIELDLEKNSAQKEIPIEPRKTINEIQISYPNQNAFYTVETLTERYNTWILKMLNNAYAHSEECHFVNYELFK